MRDFASERPASVRSASVVVSFSPVPPPAIAFSLLSVTPVSFSVASFVPLSLYVALLHSSLALSLGPAFVSPLTGRRRDETRRDEKESRSPRSGVERSAGNESFEIVNFRAWFMHGTREERTRAYASLCVLYVEIKREREREKWGDEKESEITVEERRGGVNDRNAARSQRDAYYRGEEVLQHPQKRLSKDCVTRAYGC